MAYYKTALPPLRWDKSSIYTVLSCLLSWWRHQIEAFSALQAICVGNSPVSHEFPTQRPVTRCFNVLFDLRLNERLSKQSWGWWFETSSCPLWNHSNVLTPVHEYASDYFVGSSSNNYLHEWSSHTLEGQRLKLIQANPHYNDAIIGAMASQITGLTIVYPSVYSGT